MWHVVFQLPIVIGKGRHDQTHKNVQGTTYISVFLYYLQVQLFDLSTAAFKCSLRGHGQQVSCLNFSHSPSHSCLVTGSADKRVRVFDYRCPSPSRGGQPALILTGHGSGVKSVQMDSWKVVSGRWVWFVICTYM